MGTADGRAQKAAVVVEPQIEIDLPFDARFTGIGRMRADAYDRLEPGKPEQSEVSDPSRRVFAGDHVGFTLREAYLDASAGPVELRLGKQQIVWGKADGLKVLDVVNPQNFREFILEDFDESRIPLWSALVEVPFPDWSIEFVWIPDKTYHVFPEYDSGARFEFTTPLLIPPPPPGISVDVRDPQRPGQFFEDSDAGARISAFLFGWDLTLNYLYHYYDVPALFSHLDTTAGVPTLIVTPRYKRTHLIGGTFSNAFGDLTVRGELGYSTSRSFSTDDTSQADLVAEMGEFSYVLGGDWYGFSDTLVSLQLFQSVLSEDAPGLYRDRVDTTLTLFVTRHFLNESLEVQGMWLYNINDGDGLLRPKVTYEVTDNLSAWVGADIFYGSRFGLFGEFDRRDRIVMGFQFGI